MVFLLFRKMALVLAVVIGIALILLLGRLFWERFEGPPTAFIPIDPTPANKNQVLLSSGDIKNLPPEVSSKADPESPGPKDVSPKGKDLPASPPGTMEGRTPETSASLKEIKASTGTSSEIELPIIPSANKSEKNTKSLEFKSKTKQNIIPPSAEKQNGFQKIKNTVIVKPGDSIYTIAAQTYHVANTSIVDQILEMNSKIANPDKLLVGQKIKLPEITAESLIIRSQNGTFQVRMGVFLESSYADFLKNQSILEGKEIKILPKKIPGGEIWYQVFLENYESREKGLEIIKRLKEKGLSPYFTGFKPFIPSKEKE